MKRSTHWIVLATVFLVFTAGLLFSQLTPTTPTANPVPVILGDARIPISTLPFTIAQPGSYFVTDTLVGVAGAHGIIVMADEVTIDLNGFSLIGGSGTFDGVHVSGVRSNIEVKNGAVRLWEQDGVDGSMATNSQFKDLRAFQNGSNGIAIGIDGIAARCTTNLNGIRGCNPSTDPCAGLAANSGSSVIQCTAKANTGNGIRTGGGVLISRCTVRDNSLEGIHLGPESTVESCVSWSNTGAGIQVSNESIVLNNTCAENGIQSGLAGIQVIGSGNRIEGNLLPGNSDGLQVSSPRNLIIKNSAYENSNLDYNIRIENSVGPIIDVEKVGDIASVTGSDHPWANFVF